MLNLFQHLLRLQEKIVQEILKLALKQVQGKFQDDEKEKAGEDQQLL
ncbi:hypothetical protein [Pedobacter sp. SYSU D00535]|nr:hypothetical protein [Pedobacter sp. SYSU D00535]